MFLATTSFKEFWNSDDELLFLGPWCTRYDRRHEWQHLKYRYLRNRWDDRDRLASDITYCARVIDRMTGELAQYLNQVHGVAHGYRYWRVLLSLWLYYYVHDLYARYVHVCEAFEQFPELRTCCLAQSCWVTPATTAEHIALYDSERYPLQLYSQVLGALGKCGAEQTAKFPPWEPGSMEPGQRGGIKGLIKRWCGKALDAAGAYVRPDILLCDAYLGRSNAYDLMWGTRFRVWPYYGTLPKEAFAQPERQRYRDGLKNLAALDEFERVLLSTLCSNFPTVFLEGYDATRCSCRAVVSQRPKVFVSAVGWWFNESFKFAAAECSEKGSRLLGFQHGGGYGLSRAVTHEMLERAIADRWYAWGWSEEERDPRIRDLPHPILSRLADQRGGSQANTVLLVSTDWPLPLNRLHNCPIEDQYEEYFAWRAKFIEGLPWEIRKRLLIRLYPKDLGWAQRSRLQAAVPDVQIDDGAKPFHRRLAEARLVVFDHPGTTFLEGLASGKPCLLYWNPEHWEWRSSAAQYLQALRGAGIYFDDPLAAAKQVQRVDRDPGAWWGTGSVHAAHRAFADRFALARRDWLPIWATELQSEVELSSH